MSRDAQSLVFMHLDGLRDMSTALPGRYLRDLENRLFQLLYDFREHVL